MNESVGTEKTEYNLEGLKKEILNRRVLIQQVGISPEKQTLLVRSIQPARSQMARKHDPLFILIGNENEVVFIYSDTTITLL